jgi:hypothetical protein
MKEKINCLNCLYCKLTNHWETLSCKKGLWQYEDFTKKLVKLYKMEIRTLDIHPRAIFNLGQRCVEMVEMD